MLILVRRIILEQQKLAAIARDADRKTDTESAVDVKERQQKLYEAVCNPIFDRACVLLGLTPSPSKVLGQHLPLILIPGFKCNSSSGNFMIGTFI